LHRPYRFDGSNRRVSETLAIGLSAKRGFHPTQRTQRKESNEMTSLLDRTITAASGDDYDAAKLWQTRYKM